MSDVYYPFTFETNMICHTNDLLSAILAGKIDDERFDRFLEFYESYHQLAFHQEKIPQDQLIAAVGIAIRFAAEKRHKILTFSGGQYQMSEWNAPNGFAQNKDSLSWSPNSCHAPDYSELLAICEKAVGIISHLTLPVMNREHEREDFSDWLTRTRKFVAGGYRMVNAREALQKRYEPYKIEPQRDCEIDEILRVYRHLWYHAEPEQVGESEKMITRIELGEVVPPFHEHGMDEPDVIEYCYRMEERLQECGIVTRDMEHDRDDGIRIFILNEPDQWCR